MAQRIETITQHVFAFTAEEITAIIDALIEAGRHDIAEEIYEELPEGEPEVDEYCCDSVEAADDSSIASLKFDIDYSGATRAADEFERLAKAAERVAAAINGPVEYQSIGDVCVIKIGETK